jgi:hypothetical protein
VVEVNKRGKMSKSQYGKDSRWAYKVAYKAARVYTRSDNELGYLDCWTLAGLTGVDERVCRAALKSFYGRKRTGKLSIAQLRKLFAQR